MLETYQKQQEHNENPEGQKPAWEPSLKEVLAKPEDSDLFGELLKYNDETDLVAKLTRGELEESDIEGLDRYRKEFLMRKERANTVKESINEDVINAYAKNNPELQKIVALVGPESYKSIVKEKLAGMAMNDPWTFDFLASAVEDQNRFKEDYFNPLDKELEDLCKKKNISPKKYMEALATEDPEDRKKQLRGAVREGYGWFRKAADWVSAGAWSKNRVALMDSRKEDVEAMLEQMRHHQSNVGELVAGLVGNDEIRTNLAKDLVGDKIEREQKMGFREAKGKIPTTAAFETSWAEYKSTVDWENITDEDQKEELRKAFMEKQKQAFTENKKGGFWGSVFSIFLGSFVDKNKGNLN